MKDMLGSDEVDIGYNPNIFMYSRWSWLQIKIAYECCGSFGRSILDFPINFIYSNLGELLLLVNHSTD